MPNYRRLFVPGGSYFFTVALMDRKASILTAHINALRRAYKSVCVRHPFITEAICILPDHIHCVWRLPAGDSNFSMRWRLIKSEFSRSLPRLANEPPAKRTGERGIWQRRFWEHCIRDADDLDNHVNYIHFNPVKHGLVGGPDDWPYSSWHAWKRDYGRPNAIPSAEWKPPHVGE